MILRVMWYTMKPAVHLHGGVSSTLGKPLFPASQMECKPYCKILINSFTIGRIPPTPLPTFAYSRPVNVGSISSEVMVGLSALIAVHAAT